MLQGKPGLHFAQHLAGFFFFFFLKVEKKPPRGPGGSRHLQGTEAPQDQDEAGAKDADSLMVKEGRGCSPYVQM